MRNVTVAEPSESVLQTVGNLVTDIVYSVILKSFFSCMEICFCLKGSWG